MTTQAPTKPARKRRVTGPRINGGTKETRKLAAVILEVLAGGRTPEDGASAVGVSVSRYFVLEGRALEGLLKGCEPRKLGPKVNAEKESEKLRRELARLQRESVRNQTLLRLSQRAVGLPKVKTKAAKGKGKRKRKPVARALKAAKRLESQEQEGVAADREVEESVAT
jgi:hypothetical protein